MIPSGAVVCAGCERGNGSGAGAEGPKPNIVFIVVDTLRADRVGCYGAERPLTPVIDEIAGEGVLFELATSQAPWTHPSMASLFTSVYPTVHGLGLRLATTGGHDAAKMRALNEGWVTLAEVLQGTGYETAGITVNPWMLKTNGFAQGFDHYDDTDTANEASGALAPRGPSTRR